MKEFRVYWIKEEFARHYYYKSDILYRFLREYHTNQSRNDLVAQFHFITESFPMDSLMSQLTSHSNHTFHKRRNVDRIELWNKYNLITLHISEKQIKFRCETLQDAEALLFPTLRKLHLYLFIIDDHYDNFGWISTVRTSIGYNNEQVLYS